MTPSQVMRALAQKFINSKDGQVQGKGGNSSQYICDLLSDAWDCCEVADIDDQREALHFLRNFGMGGGFSEFIIVDCEDQDSVDHRELARRRAAWLLFAADRFDEGVQ